MIKLTEDDINQGMPRIATGCPIALRANAYIKKNHGVHAHAHYLWKGDPPAVIDLCTDTLSHRKVGTIALPPEAREFMTAFDAGKPCKPITLEVEVPENVRHFFIEEQS